MATYTVTTLDDTGANTTAPGNLAQETADDGGRSAGGSGAGNRHGAA